MLERKGQVESLEERQWRLLMEQARVRVAEEEAEWKLLMQRARSALENEEREWERLRAKADVKSSGTFVAVSEERASAERRRMPPIPVRAARAHAAAIPWP